MVQCALGSVNYKWNDNIIFRKFKTFTHVCIFKLICKIVSLGSLRRFFKFFLDLLKIYIIQWLVCIPTKIKFDTRVYVPERFKKKNYDIGGYFRKRDESEDPWWSLDRLIKETNFSRDAYLIKKDIVFNTKI